MTVRAAFLKLACMVVAVVCTISDAECSQNVGNTYGPATLTISGTAQTDGYDGSFSPALGTLDVVIHNNGTDAWSPGYIYFEPFSPHTNQNVWIAAEREALVDHIVVFGTVLPGSALTNTVSIYAFSCPLGFYPTPNSEIQTVKTGEYLWVRTDGDEAFITVAGSGQLLALNGRVQNWSLASASLSGMPAVVHLYRNGSPAEGREGITDRLSVKCKIIDERPGAGRHIQFKVGSHPYDKGFTTARIPAEPQPFEENAISESTQGGTLQNQDVELWVDGKLFRRYPTKTPTPFPNHVFLADFGTVVLVCDTCTNVCVAGKTSVSLLATGATNLSK